MLCIGGKLLCIFTNKLHKQYIQVAIIPNPYKPNITNTSPCCDLMLNFDSCWEYLFIDDLHISHNALGVGANIRVLLIRKSSSHSSLVINGKEFLCVAATLCLYETRVVRVVRSCVVDAKVNISKMWTDRLLYDRKFNLDILDKGWSTKIFSKGM